MHTLKRQALMDQLHTLALCIGLRPAARKMGINEKTATVWSSKNKWKLAEVFKLNGAPAHSGPTARKSNTVSSHAGLEDTFREHSDDTRLFLSAATLKASHSASEATGKELRGKMESTGLLNVARTADVVHGWTAARATPLVQIANVTLPTPEQDAKRKATDISLDEISALLNAPHPAGGGVDAQPQGGEAKPVV